ncbi:MAG: HD domain-containing protein, partial [Cyanobacteria bacterium RUI128]|nr:HD domain-containing protein [Cyanobacteria bacterium RUI128]
SETKNFIEKHKGRVMMPAVERRNCEILKLFGGKYADRVLLDMDRAGLIDIIFPIMLDVKKVPPNTHHHLGLFNHSIETVKQIQLIYENSEPEVKEHLEEIDFGGDTRLAHLKFAGFLHDIGKFSTWTIEDDGRHRFIRHDEIGEQLAKGILRKSKFSRKQIDYISGIIRHHMYPSSVISASNLTDKVYMRYVRKAGDNAIDLITIAKADRLSARGPMVTDEMVKENIDGLNTLQNFYLTIKPTLKPIPKLLDGNDVMKILGIEPSEELGRIMDALHEAQLDGKVNTREDAEIFVKSCQHC